MYGQTPSASCAQSESVNVQSASTTCCPGLICRCSGCILCLLAFLFAGALGLILGAYFSGTLLLNIAAVIVGAVILLILMVGLIIYRSCMNCKFCC